MRRGSAAWCYACPLRRPAKASPQYKGRVMGTRPPGGESREGQGRGLIGQPVAGLDPHRVSTATGVGPRSRRCRRGWPAGSAQAPQRLAGSTDLCEPRSVLDPSGSRTISRSIIGPSFVSCSLIRCNNSSSNALSVGFLLSSPASRTAARFG